MRKYNRVLALFLSLILVVSLAWVVPVHAVALDPVSWLYTIWVAYGQQFGVTVSTMGGDEFAQDGFSALFQEWQQSRVAQGLQQAVTTLDDFVRGVSAFVSVAPGSSAGGVLHTILALRSGIVEPLAQFWNWLIKDKLGGTSVDSTDFNSSSGNVAVSTNLFAGQPYAAVSPFNYENVISQGVLVGSNRNGASRWWLGSNVPDVYVFRVGSSYYAASGTNFQTGIASVDGSYRGWSNAPLSPRYSQTYQLYYSPSNIMSGLASFNVPNPNIVVFPSFASIDAALEYIAAGNFSSGSITVAPDAGVDVLGFPDASDPDYVPADTNVGWNIPYDQAKDTNGYLEEAYDKVLDNELTTSENAENPPVEGTGEVEDVGSYVVPGLSTVFPFCIPFDIYEFLTLLRADPAPPHFQYTFVLPEQLGGAEYEVDLDFDNPTFNALAQLLRSMELIAFIVGLAMVTRKTFTRG